jgi:hypothetical protein
MSCGHRTSIDGHVPLPRVAISRPWHAGSAIRGSGGGGLARRAITAATAVVVPAVVATSMTVVAVLVIVLVPGAQRWCKASLGQPKDLYYPCGSPPVAGRPKL